MIKNKSILIIALIFSTFQIFSQTESNKTLFRFKYSKGDKIGIVSKVEEDVKINGRTMPHATILNRISMTITNTDEKGRGHHEANFMTSESFSDYGFFRAVDWDSYTTKSKYWRDKNGYFEIADEYFMPIVRDLPIFPEEPIEIGATWIKDGYEAEDFRKNFGLHTPLKVPFTATYKYLRDEEYSHETNEGKSEKRKLQVIQVKYKLMFESPEITDVNLLLNDPPITTLGSSTKTIWWDNERGQIDHYIENFRITIESYSGDVFIFTGQSTAEVTDFVKAATDDNVKIIQDKVSELGLENVSVSKSDKGLKIALENIQFEPDSAKLVYKEQKKLRDLAKILKSFPNDILVTGHTASVDDDEESCQVLSEARADAVANFLVKLHVRNENHIYTDGFGSKRPIGDNETEEGRKKNRRVEITILDN